MKPLNANLRGIAGPVRRGRWLAIAAVAVAALLLPAPSGAYVQRAPSSFFGVNGQGVQGLSAPSGGDPVALNADLTSIRGTGVSWVRAGLDWAQVEPTQPLLGSHTYNWTASDAWVTSLAQHGLRWHVTLRNPPVWSQDALQLPLCVGRDRQMLPPKAPAAFGTFAGAVAKRYGPGGTFWKAHPALPALPVNEYEIFNEENDRPYACPRPDPATYAHLYVAAHDAIHAVDPSARVVVGGLAPHRFLVAPPDPDSENMLTKDYLWGMLGAEPGLPSKIDAVGVHSYRRDPADVLADLAWYRRILERVGLGSAPLEVTETGWPTKGPNPSDDVSEGQRAVNYRQLTDAVARTDCNIVGFSPFTWVTAEQDTTTAEDWYGIANSNGSLKPSGQAYADEVKLFLGQGTQPAPRTTQRVCGLALPDSDGDGTPDQSDDYPLDPALQSGSGEHNAADDPAPQDRFQPARVPDEFFGVTGIEGVRALQSEDQHVHYAAMHDAGVGSVRGIVRWSDIEPLAPDSPYHDYQWTELDRSVRRAAIHDLRWRPAFRSAPQWALDAASSTQARGQFARFLTAFAQRYGRGGSFWDENRGLPQLPITDYEIWYRANSSAQWVDGTASASEYADFYLAARDALHAVDPGATATISLANVGVQSDFDFVRTMVSARPALAGGIDGAHLTTAQTPEPAIEADVADVRAALDATGNQSAPITLELALPQAGPGAIADSERRSEYETLLDRMARSDCGVAGVFPRAWSSAEASTASAEDWVGIAHPDDGSLYLAGQGYRQEALLLEGRTADRAPYGTVHICGRAAPDTDGDGVPDESDDFPLDPDRVSGSDANGDGVFNQFDPTYVPGSDTTAPVVQIDSGPGGPTRAARPSFTFSSEAGASFECRFDTEAQFAPCPDGTYAPASPLADGQHAFWVRAADSSGNMSTPVSRSFSVDTAGPVAQFDSGVAPGSVITTRTPTFTFSTSEGGGSFECRVDADVFAACSSPYTTPTLTEGAHTVSVRALDSLGNPGPPVSRSFTVDVTAPAAQIDSGPTGAVATAAPRFTFSATGQPTRFECRLDGAAFAACSSPRQLSGLQDGSHVFSVRAADAAGNMGAPVSQAFAVDTTGPNVTYSDGPSTANPTNDTTPTFQFSGSETGSTMRCAVDGGALASCSSPFTTDALAEGDHTISVRATDPLGNVGPVASRPFTIDLAPPTAHIDSGPATGTTIATGSTTYAFSANGRPVRFDCSLDGAQPADCSSPNQLSGMADGQHVFSIRAADAAGNLSQPVTRTFTVDATAPGPPVLSGTPDDATRETAADFSWSGESGGGFQCSLDGAAFQSCASPRHLSGLAEGSHAFDVRQVDGAGNVGATAEYAWTVDLTPPDTTITRPTRHRMTNRTPTFRFVATDAPARSGADRIEFTCRIDGRAWGPCSSPLTTDRLAVGTHEFDVYATDQAGNVEQEPAAFPFRIVSR